MQRFLEPTFPRFRVTQPYGSGTPGKDDPARRIQDGKIDSGFAIGIQDILDDLVFS